MPRDTTVSPNRVVAFAIGALYLALGALSFLATSGIGFFDPSGVWLLDVLAVNPAQNVLHLVLGAALVLGGLSAWPARVNSVCGAALLAFGIAGLFLSETPMNILAFNGASNLLHFAASACLLTVGLGARR